MLSLKAGRSTDIIQLKLAELLELIKCCAGSDEALEQVKSILKQFPMLATKSTRYLNATPITTAAACMQLSIIAWLIRLGADITKEISPGVSSLALIITNLADNKIPVTKIQECIRWFKLETEVYHLVKQIDTNLIEINGMLDRCPNKEQHDTLLKAINTLKALQQFYQENRFSMHPRSTTMEALNNLKKNYLKILKEIKDASQKQVKEQQARFKIN